MSATVGIQMDPSRSPSALGSSVTDWDQTTSSPDRPPHRECDRARHPAAETSGGSAELDDAVAALALVQLQSLGHPRASAWTLAYSLRPVREEGPDPFTLPECPDPPWSLLRGDRVCWYTFRALVTRTAPVLLSTQRPTEEHPPEVSDQLS